MDDVARAHWKFALSCDLLSTSAIRMGLYYISLGSGIQMLLAYVAVVVVLLADFVCSCLLNNTDTQKYRIKWQNYYYK